MLPKRRLLFGIPPGQWLAVSAIAALMYAILYPVFQKVHEHSGPGCSSNMRELGQALAQYEQDTNGILPSGVNTAGNDWAGQIYNFIPSKRTYRCRDDDHDGSYISYAENRNLVGQLYGNLTAPAGTVALYEFTTLGCDPSQPETVSATGLSAPQNSIRHSSPQSSFGLDFLLADSHVKYLTPGQVSGGANAVPPTRKGNYLATFAVK